MHSVMLLIITCVLSLRLENALSQTLNEDVWRESYAMLRSCEPRAQQGQWCNWGNWGPCEATTCTRKRFRKCNCPPATNWITEACETNLPQNEYFSENKLQTHTRMVRETLRGRCTIPFFFKSEFHGDCVNLHNTDRAVCQVENKRDGIFLEPCRFTLAGEMEEMDLGACGDWRLAQGWGHMDLLETERMIHSIHSPMGKHCFNQKLHFKKIESLELCNEVYYFSESGQRNVFSNLNNLAFHLENCRFACAIMPKCVGLEYVHESLCSLLMTVNVSKMTKQLGTLIERKPDECVVQQMDVEPVGYPFGLALTDISASLNG